jgi:hypothetical protein
MKQLIQWLGGEDFDGVVSFYLIAKKNFKKNNLI